MTLRRGKGHQGLKSVMHRNESPRDKLKACSLGPRLQAIGLSLQPTGVETPVNEEKENREESSLIAAGTCPRTD